MIDRILPPFVRRFAAREFLMLVLFFGAADPLLSQQKQEKPKAAPPSLANTLVEDSRLYLAHLGQLRQDLHRFENDPQWRGFLVQSLGTEYSYVGRYHKALEMFDGVDDGETRNPRPADLNRFEACDAVTTLLQLADRYQVIMINEAHHVPMHRAFTLQLLEGLHRKGFRYFAAETLTVLDDALPSRGYPIAKTGWYTREPVYADLVRTALRLGYKVVPYEFEAAASPYQSADPVAAQNAREEGQAKNLKERILAKEPKAKIIVHAGYAHIGKKTAIWELNGKKGQVRFMAGAFRALTGIDPLSVDQTLMSEHSKPEKESVDFRLAVERGLVKDRAVVLRDKETKEFFVPDSVRGNYDLDVSHPRSRYENGRPSWLALGGRRHPHTLGAKINPPKGSSYLAQAFLAKETSRDAIPVDQIEYAADEPTPTLWLPPGEARVRIVDDTGKILHEYVTGSSPQ